MAGINRADCPTKQETSGGGKETYEFSKLEYVLPAFATALDGAIYTSYIEGEEGQRRYSAVVLWTDMFDFGSKRGKERIVRFF